MSFFDDFGENVFNPFISNVGEGLNLGFQQAGQVAGSTLATALPIWTKQTIENQSFDQLAKPTFNQNFSEVRVEEAGATMKGPFGTSGEIDTTTIVLGIGVVVLGVLAAVKL